MNALEAWSVFLCSVTAARVRTVQTTVWKNENYTANLSSLFIKLWLSLILGYGDVPHRRSPTWPLILASTGDMWLISQGKRKWWVRLPVALLAWLLFVLCVTLRAGQRGCTGVTNVSRWVISISLCNKHNGIKSGKWKQISSGITPSLEVMQWPWTDFKVSSGYFARGCTKVI